MSRQKVACKNEKCGLCIMCRQRQRDEQVAAFAKMMGKTVGAKDTVTISLHSGAPAASSYTSGGFAGVIGPVQESCTGDPFEFAVGSLMTWRRFALDDGRLFGARRVAWESTSLEAGCARSTLFFFLPADVATPVMPASAQHPVPNENCQCGIYAFAEPDIKSTGLYTTEAMMRESRWLSTPGPLFVNAVVECWGKVLVGTKGVRAEKARIIALNVEKQWRFVQELVDVPNPGDLASFPLGCDGAPDLNMRFETKREWRQVDPPAEEMKNLRDRYPEVLIYDDHDEMLTAHPLSPLGTE